MNDHSDSTTSFSRLTGFTPVDEPRDVPARRGSGRWAVRAVFWTLAGLPLAVLIVLFIGVSAGAVLPVIAGIAIIGLKFAARRADQADQSSREQDDEHRKLQEDDLLAQRLAEARQRMNDESYPQ